MGVAGVAIATLTSRAFCAIVVLRQLHKPGQMITIDKYHEIRPDRNLIGKVLGLGIPAGIENSMFQFGKLMIQSTVSAMGTVAIAALCFQMIFWITVFKPIVWVGSFTVVQGIRAAGDVKYVMVVSTVSMWICRVSLCIFLARYFGMGPMAVWIGMLVVWGVSGSWCLGRFHSRKWLGQKVLA